MQMYSESNSSASSPSLSSSSLTESTSSPLIPIGANEKRHMTQSFSPEYKSYCNPVGEVFLDASMTDEADFMGSADVEANTSSSRPANRFFPDGVVDILNKWFYENQNYPYPDENMTNILAKDANISAKQVRKWFANKRVRSNKCYKQTFRVKKETKPLSSRRQTKSVSDSDGLQLNNARSYMETQECNEGNSHLQHSKPYLYDHMAANLSSASSSSSSSSPSSSFSASSPIIKTEMPNLNAQPVLSSMPAKSNSKFYQNDDEKGSTYGGQANGTSAPSIAALYDSYFFMNILQNQSMALQAIIANRLLSLNGDSLNQTASNDTQEFSLNNSIESSASSSFSSTSPLTNKIHKRKTHLSNRFLNESNLLNESTNSNKLANDFVKHEPHQYMQPIGGDNYYRHHGLMSSSFSLDELSKHSATTCVPVMCQQQFQMAPLKPIRKTKINFGDISDLIN